MRYRTEKYKNSKGADLWRYVITVDYSKPGGRIKASGFKKMKDAESAAKERIKQIEAEVENSQPEKKEKALTIAAFAKSFLISKRQSGDIEETTAARYKIFNQDIIKHFGEMTLEELDVIGVEGFYGYLKNDRNLSNATVVKTHRYLLMMLDNAEKKKLIRSNPARLADKPSVDKYEMTVWDSNSVRTYVDALKPSFLYPLIMLAIETGARLGELLALTWDDIDLKNNTMSITKSVAMVNREIVIKVPKTKKSKRTIALLPSTVGFLKTLRTRIDTDIVIHDRNGMYFSPKYISKRIKTEFLTYNVPVIRFHDLRHTHASMMLISGVDPKVISERLGHADVAFTLQTYVHIGLDHQKNELEKLTKILAPS